MEQFRQRLNGVSEIDEPNDLDLNVIAIPGTAQAIAPPALTENLSSIEPAAAASPTAAGNASRSETTDIPASQGMWANALSGSPPNRWT